MMCDYGCDQIGRFQIGSRRCCSRFVSQCQAIKAKNSKAHKNKRYLRKRDGKPARAGISIPSPFRGKSLDEIHGVERADQIRARLSQTSRGRSHPQSQETREKLRQIINERYTSGWTPQAGRAKKLIYVSPVAGTVNVDGNWEYEVCKYLDILGLTWRRNTDRFPYINLKGQEARYTPDFWVEEWQTYLEIKGYETALDRCKWVQFKKPLIVWKKTEMQEVWRVNQVGLGAAC